MIDINVHHYLHFDTGQLAGIEAAIAAANRKGVRIMSTLDELTATVAEVKTAVQAFGPAVNAFEARITSILQSAGISAADQAKIDAAVADLKATAATAGAALADAADGIDEGATLTP